jgi:hypothetical protein
MAFWLAVTALAVGMIGSTLIPWRSSTLSADSIERRFYWSGSAVAAVMLFISQWPDWTRGTLGALALCVGLVSIAFLRTSHIKIGGRIYAAFPVLREPDRPPIGRD